MSAGAPGAASSWRPVAAYTAVSACNQMLWLTFTPFTTDAAAHYGVSSDAVGWLAEIFPLLYVVLAVPSGRLLDRGLPRWLALGALLTAAGAVLRLAGDVYPTVLAGQVLVAVAQPVVLNAVIGVSSAYLRPADRATGISVSSAGIFAGMVLALVLGAAVGSAHLPALLAVQAAVSLAAAGWLCVELRRPSAAGPAPAPVPLREVWADRPLRWLTVLVCAGFGVFVALTTWLQALLHPSGVSDAAAGYLLLAMVVTGVIGSAVVPPLLARRRCELGFVLASVLAAGTALACLAAAPREAAAIPAVVVVGAFLLPDLPVVLGLAEHRAGPASGTAGALIWLAGNAAGLVAALAVQVLQHHPSAAFALLAALLLVALPALRPLRAAFGAAAPPRAVPATPEPSRRV